MLHGKAIAVDSQLICLQDSYHRILLSRRIRAIPSPSYVRCMHLITWQAPYGMFCPPSPASGEQCLHAHKKGERKCK